MFKFFSYFIICLTVNFSFGQEFDQKLHDLCIYPTVKITDLKETSGGSGFIVRSELVENKYHNIILSAAHITDQNNFSWVLVAEYDQSQIIQYKKYPLIIHANDKKRDILIGIFISEMKMPSVNLHFDEKFFVNTKVFHVGYTLLDDASIDFGIITQPKSLKPENFKGMIRTNCHTYFGDSGGPLFLEENYSVIGICHAIRSFKGNHLTQISYYSPITDLKEWDKETNYDLNFVYDKNKPIPTISKENKSKVIDEFKKSE